MLETLPRRERQLLDALFALGEAGAEQIRAAMPDPPSNSAVRAMLARLLAKGAVARRSHGQGYLYAPVISPATARASALRQIVATFFDGSPASAAAALIDMSEDMDEAELRRLEDLVRSARSRS